MRHYYDLCCRNRGRIAHITDRSGKIHVGRITRVTPNRVFIQPTGRNLGGFGYGFFGGGYGFGYAYPPYSIALSFIAGFAIGGLLFW